MKIFHTCLVIILILSLGIPPAFAEPDAVTQDTTSTPPEVIILETPSEPVMQEVTSVNESTTTTESVQEIIVDAISIPEPELKNIQQDYVAGEVIVKFKDEKIELETSSGRRSALNFASSRSLQKTEDIAPENISILSIKDGATVEEKITELEKDSRVEYAQPNYQYYPAIINTDDTYQGLQWGLDNTGQTVTGTYSANNPGTSDSDIDLPEAWAINPGTTTQIIVAVVDDGVAYNHPDLVQNMWDGSTCVNENGASISGGCNHGYDFDDNDITPLPIDSSHGTHIAGIIAAVRNNAKGVTGIAPYAKIMAIRTSFTTADNIKSINFAKQNGAKVINASWLCYALPDQGGSHANCDTYSGTSYDFSDQALSDAIANFPGLFITASGNGTGDADDSGDDHESHHAYPCDLPLANIICVTATDQSDSLASFADYGINSVDVGAPGVNIYSTTASTEMFSEGFQSVTSPNIPTGWTRGGTNNNWGTYTFSSGATVLFGDRNTPYADNALTTITTPPVDLSGANSAVIRFYTRCDTEYNTNAYSDYMELFSFSTSIGKWDEADLDEDTIENSGPSPVRYVSFNVPSQHLVTGAQFTFQWKSNSTENNHEGCFIDDVLVEKFSDGSDERYGYMSGTSMASPHVAGLAALLMGYGSNLSTSEVKNIILQGDSVAALNGKTFTGKRINARTALTDTTPPVITLLGSSTVNISTGGTFTDSGATAVDNFDGTITVITTGTVDPATAGTYTLTYGATDRAGNATTATRTIHVSDPVIPDTTPPVTTQVSSGGGSSSGGGGGGGGGGSRKAVSTVPVTNAVYAVKINKDDAQTSSTKVTLIITPVTDAKQMQISNSSDFSSASWVPFKKTYSWTLTSGSGKKTVYVRYGKNNKEIDKAKDTITLTEKVVSTKVSKPTPTSPSTKITKTTTKTPVVKATVAQYLFTKTLTIGARSQDVTELQKILIKKKHLTTSATGYYGTITAEAVKAYQRARKIPATGIVDQKTRELLNKGN